MSPDTTQGVYVTVKVVPGSSRTQLAGTLDDMLKIKVAAPPEKGKANKMLVAYLAKQLGIRKNALQITSGQTSSIKQIWIEGLTQNDVQRLYR